MYNQEEKKALRLRFWNRFAAYSAAARRRKGKPAKWILDRTGIKQMKLKFDFEEEFASVGIDIETRNMDKRIDLYDRLEKIAPQLEKALGPETEWHLEYKLPTGKPISRVAAVMQGAGIYREEDWDKVVPFFYKKMTALETVFLEYKDFLSDK